eukprot:CAMPEP_0172904440 /NCGR_PEP_ID=MMETSP1075-20121228/172631_1 /TAXON_ID=2916 /ORGANISM="Ceratium fusus, Strain PA161109" /LENGTH=367 /DNA_ID=CAMNT_0013761469 /DNA_START=63 /DNA_END=1166 /DNA_ORIENTATION=-
MLMRVVQSPRTLPHGKAEQYVAVAAAGGHLFLAQRRRRKPNSNGTTQCRAIREIPSIGPEDLEDVEDVDEDEPEECSMLSYYGLDTLAHKLEDVEDCDGIDDEAAEGAEDEICELLGWEMGDNLVRNLNRPFSDTERLTARCSAGCERAVSGQEQPQAIWLIGPSASGKSTLAPIAASWVGIDAGDFVMVDGEFFRDSHNGYQDALSEGKQHGCVWWGAYLGIRENVNREKQAMLRDSIRAHQNLVIPSTCLRKSQCIDVVKKQLKHGYKVHVVGIYGDRDVIVDRGRKRAMDKGKRYDPREFGLALKQFAPMLRLCNGRFFMVCTTSVDCSTPTDQGAAPLSETDIKDACMKVLNIYLNPALEEPN